MRFEDFEMVYKSIGSLEVTINCYLVQYNVRKSLLLQPYDRTIRDIFDTILNEIAVLFPEFVFHKIDQGELITKEKILPFNKDDYTFDELGKFLSYPCPGDIIDKRNFAIHYNIKYKEIEDSLFTVICESQNNKKIVELKEQIINVLNKINENIDEPIKLKIKIKKIYSIEEIIIDTKNDNITKIIEKEIDNILWNFNFSILLALHEDKIIDLFDKENRTMLLLALSYCKADFTYAYKDNKQDTLRKIDWIVTYYHLITNKTIKEDTIRKAYEFYN